MAPVFPHHIRGAVLGNQPISTPSFPYGAVTLYGGPFQVASGRWAQEGGWSTPHIPTWFPMRVRFGLVPVHSPLLGESRFDFLSSAYLDASVRPVPAPQLEAVERHPTPKRGMPGNPIRASPDQRLLAATRGFSQLAAPFFGPQAELSTGWRILA